jgi:mannosyltransferase OCH1-like enzyme
MNIPKIIHQIWFQGESQIPPHLKEYRETWIKIHTDFEIILWDQVSIEKLLKEYNLSWLSELYYSYDIMIQKIDIAKYFILYKYGGIYVDMDMKCIKSINAVLNTNHNIILSECHSPIPFRLFYGVAGHDIFTPIINNGIIIIRQKNDLMKIVLEQAYKNKDSKLDILNRALYIFKTTGPVCLENAIVEYKKINNEPIKILDYTYFEGKSFGSKNCKLTDNAIAVHIYEGSWVPSGTAFIVKAYFCIMKNPNITIAILLVIVILFLFFKFRNKY